MACIDSIWFHQNNKTDGKMKVNVCLKPSGNVSIEVPMPKNFHAAVLAMAQTAADAHEAQMRAEILGDTTDSKGGES